MGRSLVSASQVQARDTVGERNAADHRRNLTVGSVHPAKLKCLVRIARMTAMHANPLTTGAPSRREWHIGMRAKVFAHCPGYSPDTSV